MSRWGEFFSDPERVTRFAERAREIVIIEAMEKDMAGERVCREHGGFDTDGDDECGKYATATPFMKARIAPCRFTDSLPL